MAEVPKVKGFESWLSAHVFPPVLRLLLMCCAWPGCVTWMVVNRVFTTCLNDAPYARNETLSCTLSVVEDSRTPKTLCFHHSGLSMRDDIVSLHGEKEEMLQIVRGEFDVFPPKVLGMCREARDVTWHGRAPTDQTRICF